MKKSVKIWWIVGASLVFFGCVIFGGAMMALDWNFAGLSTNRYETNQYEITDAFGSISVDVDTADLVFVPSDGERVTVTCYEQENVKHTVSVKDGVLVIEVRDERRWYEHIGINFETSKITVALPAGEYGAMSVRSHTGKTEIAKDFCFESMDIRETTGAVRIDASVKGLLKIQTTTGDIAVEGVTAKGMALSVTTGRVTVSGVQCSGDVSVHVSTGDAKLTDLTCKSLISEGSTGDLVLKNVIADGRFDIERDTGDVRFDASDAAEIFVETDTGSVTGTLKSEKVFITHTDTGKTEVPKSVTGGRCEIETDTGDIRIRIQK